MSRSKIFSKGFIATLSSLDTRSKKGAWYQYLNKIAPLESWQSKQDLLGLSNLPEKNCVDISYNDKGKPFTSGDLDRFYNNIKLYNLIKSLYPQCQREVLPRINPNIQDQDGRTALHLAAMTEASEEMVNKGCAEYLLSCGAEIDMIDKYGRTALHYAVLFEKTEIMELLVENGAYQLIMDNKWRTPLDLALEEGSGQSVSYLLSRLDTSSKALDADSIFIDEVGIKGKTLLHRVAEGEFSEQREGNTPLALALKNGHTAIVETIINNGGSIGIYNHSTGKLSKEIEDICACAEIDAAQLIGIIHNHFHGQSPALYDY